MQETLTEEEKQAAVDNARSLLEELKTEEANWLSSNQYINGEQILG